MPTSGLRMAPAGIDRVMTVTDARSMSPRSDAAARRMVAEQAGGLPGGNGDDHGVDVQCPQRVRRALAPGHPGGVTGQRQAPRRTGVPAG